LVIKHFNQNERHEGEEPSQHEGLGKNAGYLAKKQKGLKNLSQERLFGRKGQKSRAELAGRRRNRGQKELNKGICQKTKKGRKKRGTQEA